MLVANSLRHHEGIRVFAPDHDTSLYIMEDCNYYHMKEHAIHFLLLVDQILKTTNDKQDLLIWHERLLTNYYERERW